MSKPLPVLSSMYHNAQRSTTGGYCRRIAEGELTAGGWLVEVIPVGKIDDVTLSVRWFQPTRFIARVSSFFRAWRIRSS